MSDYTCTTREIPVAQLKPELLQAICANAGRHRLGNVADNARLCCDTHSEKKMKGSLASLGGGDPDPFNDTALLLTPAWLIWACGGPKSGGVVSSTRLRNSPVTA